MPNICLQPLFGHYYAFYYFHICVWACCKLPFYITLSKLPKPDERPLIPGLYLMIVKNYKRITIPNNSLNLAHPIVIAQLKPQPKEQMQVILPFRLTPICRPKCACLT